MGVLNIGSRLRLRQMQKRRKKQSSFVVKPWLGSSHLDLPRLSRKKRTRAAGHIFLIIFLSLNY